MKINLKLTLSVQIVFTLLLVYIAANFYQLKFKEYDTKLTSLQSQNDELKERINIKKDEVVNLKGDLSDKEKEKFNIIKSFDKSRALDDTRSFKCPELNGNDQYLEQIKDYLSELSLDDEELKYVCYRPDSTGKVTYFIAQTYQDNKIALSLYKEKIPYQDYKVNKNIIDRPTIYTIPFYENLSNINLLSWEQEDELIYSVKLRNEDSTIFTYSSKRETVDPMEIAHGPFDRTQQEYVSMYTNPA